MQNSCSPMQNEISSSAGAVVSVMMKSPGRMFARSGVFDALPWLDARRARSAFNNR
jgi:hypothetical protein